MVRPTGALRALLSSLLLATVLSGFASLSPTALANHDTLSWRFDGTASYHVGYEAGPATIFADRAGHFYVFYSNTSTTTGLSNLNVSKFATRGSSGLPQKLFDRRVNQAPVGNDTVFADIPPAVAMDATGALYVAYSEIHPGVGADVYMSKSVDGGSTWKAEVRVSPEGPGGNDTFPSIAVAPNGNVFVAWIQSWGTESVSAAVSTNGGASFGSARNITGVPRQAGTTAVSITADSVSRVYMVYDDYDNVKKQFKVNLTWSDDGASWSPPRTLSGPNSLVYVPVLKADRADRLHLAWIDASGLASQVWYARSDDRGANWTSPVAVSQDAAAASVRLRTSFGISGGTLMVAWTATQGGVIGLAYSVSADVGDSWSGERFFAVPGVSSENAVVDADENGTFYAAPVQSAGSPRPVFLEYWYGPPTVPTITTIGRGAGQLDVRWTPSPEPNVDGYRVWRSSDGVSYTIVASVGATSTNYTDRALTNETYWYSVQAVNDQGITSHLSPAVRATVARSLEEQIADLQAEIAALEARLAKLNDSSSQEAAALQARINELQARLDALQGEKADQTTGIVTMGLLIIVAVLLALLVVKLLRTPKSSRPIVMAPLHRFALSEELRSEELGSEESANLPLPGFDDDL